MYWRVSQKWEKKAFMSNSDLISVNLSIPHSNGWDLISHHKTTGSSVAGPPPPPPPQKVGRSFVCTNCDYVLAFVLSVRNESIYGHKSPAINLLNIHTSAEKVYTYFPLEL